MNYRQYYENQIGSGIPVFSGQAFQKGFGLGGTFRKFFKWVMPLLSKHALPLVRNVGKELVKGVSNVALDTIEGKDLKESANSNIEKTINNIKTNIQAGNGKKRRPRKPKTRDLLKPINKPKKFPFDIFSKNRQNATKKPKIQ